MARHDQRWTDHSLRCYLCHAQLATYTGVLCSDCRTSAIADLGR
jgi:hypothetical protein